MNRAWLPGALALMVLVAAISGSTLALWTSQASNDDNTFTTTTFVNFRVYRDDGDAPPDARIFYTTSGLASEINPDGYWHPGKVVNKTMVLQNDNTINLQADAIRLNIHGLAGVPNAIRDDLLEHLRITITNSSGLLMLIDDKTLYECSDVFLGPAGWCVFDNPVPILASAFHPAKVSISFVNHPHADNHLMGLSGAAALLVDFVVHATQTP